MEFEEGDSVATHPSLTSVDVTPGAVSELMLREARERGVDVVVFPLRRTESGLGVYPQDNVFIVKELRAAGVAADFLDPSATRTFEVKLSAVAAAVLTVLLGVASAAGWDAIKLLLGAKGRGDSRRTEVTYAELTADGTQRQWSVKGDADAVVEAIDHLRQTPEES